jgi:hypothetical protein
VHVRYDRSSSLFMFMLCIWTLGMQFSPILGDAGLCIRAVRRRLLPAPHPEGRSIKKGN